MGSCTDTDIDPTILRQFTLGKDFNVVSQFTRNLSDLLLSITKESWWMQESDCLVRF